MPAAVIEKLMAAGLVDPGIDCGQRANAAVMIVNFSLARMHSSSEQR